MTIHDAPVSVGEVLAGKYRTERLLGMGNMGVVVEATNLGLEQRVALKFLLAHRLTHQGLHDRFLREARAAAKLTSQHVTRVMDVGMLESGAPYMVMELLNGHDLAAELEQRGQLPVTEAVEYVLQACEAVGEAHRAGIVHRDLKPANLFLTRNADGSPCIKVFDFGVSKTLGGNQLQLTSEGQAVGSPLYMSPEQMMAKPDVDTRSDIWALGVILFELIAGKTPFHAETMMGLHTNVLVKGPTPLTTYLPSAPPGLEAIILQCLDKERDRRWQDVAAFASALAQYAPARVQSYPARVAGMLGTKTQPSRPTMTLEAAKLRASEPAANLPAHVSVATTSGATSQPAGMPVRRGPGAGVFVLSSVLIAGVLAGGAFLRLRVASAPAAPSAAAVPASTAVPAPTEASEPPPPAPSATVAADASSSVVEPTTPLVTQAPTAAASAKVGPTHAPGVGAIHVPAARPSEPTHSASPKSNVYDGRK
jgi:serine/threonine-protein kinase